MTNEQKQGGAVQSAEEFLDELDAIWGELTKTAIVEQRDAAIRRARDAEIDQLRAKLKRVLDVIADVGPVLAEHKSADVRHQAAILWDSLAASGPPSERDSGDCT